MTKPPNIGGLNKPQILFYKVVYLIWYPQGDALTHMIEDDSAVHILTSDKEETNIYLPLKGINWKLCTLRVLVLVLHPFSKS